MQTRKSWMRCFLFGIELSSLAMAAPSSSESGALLSLTRETIWVVPAQDEQLSTPLRLALRDIKRDWYGVFGIPALQVPAVPAAEASELLLPPLPVVFLGSPVGLQALLGDAFTAFQRDHLLDKGPEAHACAVLPVNATTNILPLVCSGADERKWTERAMGRTASVRVPNGFARALPGPSFRFRAFFINDEDQLGGMFRDPLGEAVFSLQAWDLVFESILRLRGNAVLVGTIPFIDEPSLDLAARRGLFIGQHHFTLLGTNVFQWPAGVPYSFPSSPEVVTNVWTAMCNFSLARQRNMLWTVGYRGLNDYPFWNDDPRFNTPAKRGALISRAMQLQVELIKNATAAAAARRHEEVGAPKQWLLEEASRVPDIFTYLWDEAEDLYAQGFLKVPEGVSLVHADDGSGIVTSPPALISKGNGIYYHVMMENVGSRNQLTEMVPPRRIFDQLRVFVEKGATRLLQINTSDLRAVALTLKAVMDFAWSPSQWLSSTPAQAEKEFIANWTNSQYSQSEVAGQIASLWLDYFRVPYIADNATRYGEQFFSHQIRAMAAAVTQALVNATALPVSQAAINVALVQGSLPALQRLHTSALDIKRKVAQERFAFFTSHSLAQIEVHLNGCRGLLAASQAVLALSSKNSSSAATLLVSAKNYTEAIFTAFHSAEQGRWEGWFAFDELDNFFSAWDNIRQASAALSGTRFTGTRFFHGGTGKWSTEFQYQQLNSDPLAYPFFHANPFLSLAKTVTVLCQDVGGSCGCENNAVGGSFIAPCEVALSTVDQGLQADIHFTLDGTRPSLASPVYSVPLKLATNMTVAAVACSSEACFDPPIFSTWTLIGSQ